jgi:hypothetical protein
MSFVFKKKVLSSIMAVALASGLGMSQTASAVHVAEDGIGQVLLAPYYNVLNGWRTKVAIVNTRNDVAVKAKIVLRSRAHSTEVLDFICYLTPADVCRFDIVNVNGQAYMQSNDDSIRATFSPATFASQTAVSQMLFDDRMLSVDRGDINEEGHIEVIGVYGVPVGNVATPSGVVNVKQGMSKVDLVKIFDEARGTVEGMNVVAGTDRGIEAASMGRMVGGTCQTNVNLIDLTVANGAPCPTPAGVIRSADPNIVRLTGSVELVKEDSSDRMGYRIPALAGEIWDNESHITDPRSLETFDGRVIASNRFDVNLAVETSIGRGFGWLGADNIFELEHALATTNLMGTYESPKAGPNKTNLQITFPTKYRHRINHVCVNQAPTAAELAGALYTPPFRTNGTVEYQLTSYDNQENSLVTGTIFSGGTVETKLLYAEVNYLIPDWAYESGWYNVALNAVPGCNYAGLPTLGMAHKYFTTATGTGNSMLVESAHAPELTNRQWDATPVGNDMGL